LRTVAFRALRDDCGRRNTVMSSHQFALVEPPANIGRMTGEERYPRYMVVSGVLLFNFTIWTIVVLAIAYLA
jgi:hypothetical protein